MSFPFVQPYFGLGNSLQTAQGGSGAVGGWVELARTTLGSAGDDIDVSSLADKRYYMLLTDIQPTGSVDSLFRINNLTSSTYAVRYSVNGGADGTTTSQTSDQLQDSGAPTTPYFGVAHVANLSANEKLWKWHNCQQNAAGAGTAPTRVETVGKNSLTGAVISQFNLDNGGTGSYHTGSELVVLGWDPADTHTTNFWEELYTGSGDAGSDTGVSGFTAKKYLWIQAYLDGMPSGGNVDMVINGAASSNYAVRYNINGGTDATLTSRSDNLVYLGIGGETSGLINIFMVNDGTNEKLGIVHTNVVYTAGASNAPNRQENVVKDANTAQVTDIEFKPSSGSWGAASEFRIWGSD